MSGRDPSPPPRRVLIVGGDARAHALAWAIGRGRGVERILVAPGNAGSAAEPKTVNAPVGVHDFQGLIDLARAEAVDLTVVSPEDPLAAGIVDAFQAAGRVIFGPTRAAARLESSKAWARDFMARHGIPRPGYRAARTLEEAQAAIRELGGRCVVKADGLAAGKGVVMAAGEAEALAAARAMLIDGRLGDAGSGVVIEEWMRGPELSVMAITDGQDYRLLPPAQDHKRLADGDAGPNTGGMGSYAPSPLGRPDLLDHVARSIIEPTLAAMAAEGHPFTGCLYCGLMLTDEGPKVVEFNSRFGDPESQVQLPLVGEDLGSVLLAAASGELADAPDLAVTSDAAAVCVVLAAEGYPEAPRKGAAIRGLQALRSRADIKVFQAGTALSPEGDLRTAGGRVLSVVGLGRTLALARDAAYGAIDLGDGGGEGVAFDGMQLRRDIAAAAMAQEA